MKRSSTGTGLAAILVTTILAACGPGEATIIVALGDETSEDANALDGVEVRLLPYDRDQVFDSLTAVAAAAGMPEPEVPPDLLAAQEEIAQAQQEWRDTETRWNVLRDSLQTLNNAMEGLNRAQRAYMDLYNQYQDLEGDYNRAEQQVGRLFDNFTSLQDAAIGRMDSINIVQADWADQAFEDVSLIIAAKTELAGLEEHADTTGVEGVAAFEAAPGQYWVYARHELPYNELYWNIPIAITREEPVVLRLTRDNAVVRQIF
ncbi:MAG: hypothetical protein OXH49_04800 [Gemmatimonadetes bacterium]|nr:hypothetical protein [Gemmatimonadota bacterium]